MSQIALPLELRDRDDPERIVIGSANAHVIDALQNPARWPFHTAVLTGPARSGKSLLGRWASGQGIDVIDGVDAMEEDKVFHRWNASQESGAPLLLIANKQPWEITLPDLKSRMGGSLQLEIADPDDEMMAGLMHVIAGQRGISLPEGGAEYLVPRAARSFEEIEQLVITIDRISLERQVPPTMSVWRAALEAMQGPEQQNLF